MTIIRMCKNCDHWVPLTPGPEGAAGGSCPIKNRLTSWMSLCGEFQSKVVPLHAVDARAGNPVGGAGK